MKGEAEILRANMGACRQRIEKLAYSLDKNRALFPLTRDAVSCLTDEQEESIDALILRYSQCVSMIQDQVFRGIAYVEQEDLSDKSKRSSALSSQRKLSAQRLYCATSLHIITPKRLMQVLSD